MLFLLKRTTFMTTLLALLGLITSACGGASEPTAASTVKLTGPNAHLSNAELLKKAVANMRALGSYHFEFKGGPLSAPLRISHDMSIVGDIQLDDRGSRIKVRDDAERKEGETGLDVLITGHGWYESFDNGRTWHTTVTSTPGSILTGLFTWIWQNPWEKTPGEYETQGEKLILNQTFMDAIPQAELVDSVVTKHIVAELKEDPNQLPFETQPFEGAKRLELWISTEVTPTIRQMKIGGDNVEDGQQSPYTLTWKWSRFNEDFGRVELPPTETVKSPYAP
jgi:hypothetical protein